MHFKKVIAAEFNAEEKLPNESIYMVQSVTVTAIIAKNLTLYGKLLSPYFPTHISCIPICHFPHFLLTSQMRSLVAS